MFEYEKPPIYHPTLDTHKAPPEIKLTESSVTMRLNKKPRPTIRYPTYTGYDEVLNGLPAGLTIFYGIYGSGKSFAAREIASSVVKAGYQVLYVIGEDLKDCPAREQFTDCDGEIHSLDFSSYTPSALKSIETLIMAIKMLKPNLVIIDSLTTFLSTTSKAVPEADVREYTFKLAKLVSGSLPVIGISEVRGQGFNRNFAGGSAIGHAPILLVEFDKILVSRWDAARYDAPEGSYIWVMRVIKDRDGVANQGNEHIIEIIEEEDDMTGEVIQKIRTEKVEYQYEK